MRKSTSFNGWVRLGTSMMVAACAVMVGCASRPAATTSARIHPSAGAQQPPVIVRLVGRSYSVVISAGPKGPAYTVRTPDGQLLAENLTLEELRQSHTDLYDKLAPTFSPGRSSASALVMADIR